MRYYKHYMGNCYITEDELLQWYSVEFPHVSKRVLLKISRERGFQRISAKEYKENEADSVSIYEYFFEEV